MTTIKPAPKKRAAAKTPSQIFVLRVDLAHIKPAIWRRLEMPGNFHLGKLHNILQEAFAWTDSHLHGFEIGGENYGPGDPDPFGFGEDERKERKFRLESVAGAGSRFTYTYDFGDDWIHFIEVEKLVEPEAGVSYPRCTAGKNAAPPDDCGGPWGYANMLKAVRNPKHPEHEEYLEWLGEDFDAKDFDLDEINARLRRLKLQELNP